MSTAQKLLVVVLAATLVVVTTSFSTSAFTTTTLDRGAEVNVVTDETGLVGLVDGHGAGGLVEQTAEGLLRIDFTRGGGDGANVAATFELGSTDKPDRHHAFRIENQGTQPRDFTVGYTLDGGDSDTNTANMKFNLYHDIGGDGTVDSAFAISEGPAPSSEITIRTVATDDVVYVVVVVDTNGLTATSDLSGTLGVTASQR